MYKFKVGDIVEPEPELWRKYESYFWKVVGPDYRPYTKPVRVTLANKMGFAVEGGSVCCGYSFWRKHKRSILKEILDATS